MNPGYDEQPANTPRLETAALRPATRADIAAMHRVRLAVRENQLSSPTRIGADDYLRAIEIEGRGWVAEVAGVLVAFAIATPKDGNIWALFVDPKHEGQGHGKRLLDVLTDWLWSCGLEQVWLTTAAGTRAEAFYAARGWRREGTTASGEVRFTLASPN